MARCGRASPRFFPLHVLGALKRTYEARPKQLGRFAGFHTNMSIKKAGACMDHGPCWRSWALTHTYLWVICKAKKRVFPPPPLSPPLAYFQAILLSVAGLLACSHPRELLPHFQVEEEDRHKPKPYRKEQGPDDLEVAQLLLSDGTNKRRGVKVGAFISTAIDLVDYSIRPRYPVI